MLEMLSLAATPTGAHVLASTITQVTGRPCDGGSLIVVEPEIGVHRREGLNVVSVATMDVW